MAKVSGSYASLIRGVSEQVPHQRLPGQHWDQLNMISDPVRGLSRRQGSVKMDERLVASLADTAATRADAATFKEHSMHLAGQEFSLAYRPGQMLGGSTMPGLVMTNKDTGQILETRVSASDGTAAGIIQTGISSVCNVGNFVLMSARSQVTSFSQSDQLGATAQHSIVWVKGGAYSRTFTVRCFTNSGGQVVVSYTTMASYYQGILDTSDIPTSDPDYQKRVNDRVNDYQTRVNQHIAAAAADIQPANIANQLRTRLNQAGVPAGTVGSHIHISGGTYNVVVVDDGGEGTLIKAVSKEVESVNDLSPMHVVGKTVSVTPRGSGGGGSSYYMRAHAKIGGVSGVQDVIWREGPGTVVQPNFLFLIGRVVGNIFFVGSTPYHLQSIAGGAVPTFEASRAGDSVSSPLPAFLGSTISYLRTFQDRLMIVSGATVYLSKPGDYFNFFRDSVLTLTDNDPIEVYAEGSEGDTITAAVQMDRSLLLFGNRNQYAINGREAMVPRNAFIATQAAHEDAAVAPPTVSGNLIFFTQARERRLTVQQMQTGAYADSFDAFDITTQLDGFMKGTPRQLVAMTSPSMLVVRTQEYTNGVYVYSFMDTPAADARLFDSWSRWEWAPQAGTLFSVSAHNGNLLLWSVRAGAGGTYLVLDKINRDATLSPSPYLDSRRPYTQTQLSGSIRPGWQGMAQTSVALNILAGQSYFLGNTFAKAANLFAAVPGSQTWAEVGLNFESYCEPTAPYIRDRDDKAILDGRFTLTKLAVTVSYSVAMVAEVRGVNDPPNMGRQVTNWVCRPAGAWVLNTQQIADIATVTVPIMKEVRDYRVRLRSRSWLPMTISAMEWSGQFFTGRK